MKLLLVVVLYSLLAYLLVAWLQAREGMKQ